MKKNWNDRKPSVAVELSQAYWNYSVPMKPHGKPLLLNDKVDTMVHCYLRKMREEGGVVNTRIDVAAARGIVLKYM